MGFHEVSWALKQREGLDPSAKLLLIAVADAANNKDHCMWRGKKSFGDEAMLSDSGLKNAWSRLVERGYVREGTTADLHDSERVEAYLGIPGNRRPKIHVLGIRGSKSNPQAESSGGQSEDSRGSVSDPLRGSPQTNPKPEPISKPEETLAPPAHEQGSLVPAEPIVVEAEVVTQTTIARDITKAFWDVLVAEGRPTPVLGGNRNSFMALTKIVEQFVESGYEPQLIYDALHDTSVYTMNGITFSLNKQKREIARVGPDGIDALAQLKGMGYGR
jgi:hypothetical protein